VTTLARPTLADGDRHTGQHRNHYTSSAQLINEIANARIWGGVHFRFSTTAGTNIGLAVAHYDILHALQPDDE
jgi:hypothetical protein